jgi:hypothetical protein
LYEVADYFFLNTYYYYCYCYYFLSTSAADGLVGWWSFAAQAQLGAWYWPANPQDGFFRRAFGSLAQIVDCGDIATTLKRFPFGQVGRSPLHLTEVGKYSQWEPPFLAFTAPLLLVQ